MTFFWKKAKKIVIFYSFGMIEKEMIIIHISEKNIKSLNKNLRQMITQIAK